MISINISKSIYIIPIAICKNMGNNIFVENLDNLILNSANPDLHRASEIALPTSLQTPL
jgi:hypothetical protein